MARLRISLITLAVFLIEIASIIEGIGFPSGHGHGHDNKHCICLGRKKRDTDAVQPHFMADETPCPQTAWKTILEESILSEDAVGSVGAIQTALYRQYSVQKFLVTCSSAADAPKNGTAVATNRLYFSSSGDAYCNLVKESIWCQAVALSA